MTFRLLLLSVTCAALVSSASVYQRRKHNRDGPLDWPEFFDFDSFESTRYRPNGETDDAQYRDTYNHPNHRPEYEPVEPYRQSEESEKEPRQEDPFTKKVPAWLVELNELNNRQPAFPENSQYNEETPQVTERPIRTNPESIQDKLPPVKHSNNKKVPSTTSRPIVVEVAHSLPPKPHPQRIIPKPTLKQAVSPQKQTPLPVVPVSTPLALHTANQGSQTPTLLLPLPQPAAVPEPVHAKNIKQLEATPVYHPIQPLHPVHPNPPTFPSIQSLHPIQSHPAVQPIPQRAVNPAPVHTQPIVQVKTAHRLEPKRTMKNGFKMLMGKTPDYETLEEHMKRRHESLSAKIADGLYSYARADWIKNRIPSFRKSEGA